MICPICKWNVDKLITELALKVEDKIIVATSEKLVCEDCLEIELMDNYLLAKNKIH